MPSRRQHLPTLQDKNLLSLRHQQCRCHICSDSRHRSPWVDLGAPSSRLLPCAPSRPGSLLQGKEFWVTVVQGRLQGNVGSLCVGSRSRGSSGRPEGRAECLQRASG